MSFTPVGPGQAIMYEQWDEEGGPCSPEKFRAKADLKEGIGGRHPIDTTFENTDYELLRGECNPCGGMKK